MASGELNRQISRDLDCEAGVAPLLYGELNRNLQQVAGATGTEIAVRGSIVDSQPHVAHRFVS